MSKIDELLAAGTTNFDFLEPRPPAVWCKLGGTFFSFVFSLGNTSN